MMFKSFKAPWAALVACLPLSVAAFSLPGTASAQLFGANDDVRPESRVPGFLRNRPLGLTIGLDTPYEGSGELSMTFGLAADYGSAKAARAPLQTMSGLDLPIVDFDIIQLGISGNLWGDIPNEGPRADLTYLYPSINAGVWGAVGNDTLSLDGKIVGKVWAPEEFPVSREGYEAQVGVTLYAPMARVFETRTIDLAVRADLTFADDTYMAQHFGITAEESAASGLAAHTAGAGMKSAGFSVGTVLPLHHNLELQGAAGMVQLLDDAAASPWVVERGELTDIWGNVGIAFRF